MKQWYVLRTDEKQDRAAYELVKRAVNGNLYDAIRILKKQKMFRCAGTYEVREERMFPGYLFIRTESPEQLTQQLRRSREFPQMVSDIGGPIRREMLVPVENEDLVFLQTVCGEDLDHTMQLTRLQLDEDNRITEADGVLNQFLDQIVKLNLHKRFAVVEIHLFNRIQSVLFGLRLEQDGAL